MADRYRMNVPRQLINAGVGLATRLGVGPRNMQLLTVVGRRTGRRRTTPVALVTRDGERWLVAPYGVRQWVLNVRAAGRAELRRGRTREHVSLHDVDAATSAPVLRDYLRQNAIVRRYFDVGVESSLDKFAAEAPRHPVFRVVTERGQ